MEDRKIRSFSLIFVFFRFLNRFSVIEMKKNKMCSKTPFSQRECRKFDSHYNAAIFGRFGDCQNFPISDQNNNNRT